MAVAFECLGFGAFEAALEFEVSEAALGFGGSQAAFCCDVVSRRNLVNFAHTILIPTKIIYCHGIWRSTTIYIHILGGGY